MDIATSRLVLMASLITGRSFNDFSSSEQQMCFMYQDSIFVFVHIGAHSCTYH